MERRYRRQFMFGFAVLAVGIIALLSQLNVISADWGTLWSQWWPTIIICLGLFALVSNPRAPIGPLIVMAVGAVLLITSLGLLNIDFWGLFWPVVLIGAGLLLLLRTFHRPRQTSESSVNSTVVFWGAELTNSSRDFLGGSLTAVFGGLDVNLRGADIQERAQISAFSLFGGMEIKVPVGWRVETHGLPIFGGWENKAFVPPDPNAPVLDVNATCIFGGLTVKN